MSKLFRLVITGLLLAFVTFSLVQLISCGKKKDDEKSEENSAELVPDMTESGGYFTNPNNMFLKTVENTETFNITTQCGAIANESGSSAPVVVSIWRTTTEKLIEDLQTVEETGQVRGSLITKASSDSEGALNISSLEMGKEGDVIILSTSINSENGFIKVTSDEAGKYKTAWSMPEALLTFLPLQPDSLDAVSTYAPEKIHHLIFLTSQAYSPNFNGLAGADQLCQENAAAAGIDRNFKALLSTSDVNARDRVTIKGPVYNVKKEMVAEDHDNLWDGRGLLMPVKYSAQGDTVDDQAVWTGSDRHGAYRVIDRPYNDSHCLDWTSSEDRTGVLIGYSTGLENWFSTRPKINQAVEGNGTKYCYMHTAYLYCLSE